MNVTFILGAGSNVDYGFVTGAELMERIKQRVVSILDNQDDRWTYINIGIPQKQDDKFIYKVLKSFDINADYLSNFYDALRLFQNPSIDYFLKEYPEYDLIGKFVITLEINELETQFEGNVAGDFEKRESMKSKWYHDLFNNNVLSPENIEKNKLNFVTFNYDRSLEYFINSSFRQTYRTSLGENKAEYYLNQLKFIHIHGSLGQFSFKHDEGLDVAYSKNPSYLEKLISKSKGIRTIHEARSNSEMNEAKELIKDSEKVYFLGFGFNKENLESLVDGVDFPTETWATAYGMGRGKKKLAIQDTNNKLGLGRMISCSIEDLFENHSPIHLR